ncbi:MAG: SRPBCC family protein [Elusimicrobiota bacterium]
MSRVNVKKTIKAPADKVWQVLRAFGNLEAFIPAVNKTVLEGEGVGMKRVCTMANGNRIVERLESLDDEKRVLRYSVLETQAPISGYVADMFIRDAGEGATEIEWTSEFAAPEETRAESERQIAGLYSMSIRGLERLCREKKPEA